MPNFAKTFTSQDCWFGASIFGILSFAILSFCVPLISIWKKQRKEAHFEENALNHAFPGFFSAIKKTNLAFRIRRRDFVYADDYFWQPLEKGIHSDSLLPFQRGSRFCRFHNLFRVADWSAFLGIFLRHDWPKTFPGPFQHVDCHRTPFRFNSL
jgi:hypothetical protein